MNASQTTATLKMFLVFGDPKRLRTAELSNWTGKAVAGPRSDFKHIIRRKEAENTGVYFLVGEDPENGDPTLYIGEAESIQSRLHTGHKEFDAWTRLVFFTSSDGNLTKAHVRYIEGKMIDLARESGKYFLKNNQNPVTRLPESDQADMEIFIEKMLQILPVLNVDAFSKPGTGDGQATIEILSCKIKGVSASGYLTPDGLVIKSGSGAVLKERESSINHPSVLNKRKALISNGTLVLDDTRYVFTKDVEFTSPSAAATVVHGGHTNGLTAWVDASGRSLKEREEQSAESV